MIRLFRPIPLLVIPLVIYLLTASWAVPDRVGAVVNGSATPEPTAIFSLSLLSGVTYTVHASDLLVILALVLLYFEIVKATYTRVWSYIDHILSLFLFIAMLVMFMALPVAGTSIFFLLMLISLVDVVGGLTISLAVARRDLSFAGSPAL